MGAWEVTTEFYFRKKTLDVTVSLSLRCHRASDTPTRLTCSQHWAKSLTGGDGAFSSVSVSAVWPGRGHMTALSLTARSTFFQGPRSGSWAQ